MQVRGRGEHIGRPERKPGTLYTPCSGYIRIQGHDVNGGNSRVDNSTRQTISRSDVKVEGATATGEIPLPAIASHHPSPQK